MGAAIHLGRPMGAAIHLGRALAVCIIVCAGRMPAISSDGTSICYGWDSQGHGRRYDGFNIPRRDDLESERGPATAVLSHRRASRLSSTGRKPERRVEICPESLLPAVFWRTIEQNAPPRAKCRETA